MKRAAMYLLVLFLAAPVFAAVQGQILNCDYPDPMQPDACVDNWALDVLDESKSAIQNATGKLPRDRKSYFNTNLTGAGVHIFILDTGVDQANTEFKKLDNPSSNRFGTYYPAGTYSTQDRDLGSHGTRVAGLAAGLKFGVAKGATLHTITTRGYINDTGGAELLKRLNWVYDQVTVYGLKPAVLNMSFNIPLPVEDKLGNNLTSSLTSRVRDLINAGVVVVVSAGNKDDYASNYWPSNIPETIIVGGVDQNGNRWLRGTNDPDYAQICQDPAIQDCGSNFGSLVDLWAPAEFIRSAIQPNNSDSLAPRVRSGTSFAAPLVSGLAALHLQANPTATPAGVLYALKTNGAYLGDIDSDGRGDYLVRAPNVSPGCNVTQRIFTNADTSVDYFSRDLADSCPAGYDAYSQYNATNGQVYLGGIGPAGASYDYVPNLGYTGLDSFNYTIYTDAGATYGTGTVKVTVQPDHN